jgi:hypothetical protein
MTEDFLTEGLQNDRYLKAIQLASQFEDEIEARLFEFDQRMVDVQPELFDSNDGPDHRTSTSPSNGLAFQRINHPMNGPRAPEKRQRLNVHLYWMPPNEYARPDIDGAVRAFGYKIKGGDREADERVRSETRTGDWSVETSENPYDDNIVYYNHVSSAADITDTADRLVDHFTEFGNEFAVR